MKKLICEVDEDYLNELCEAFKQKPMGGIPTHRAWALLEGLKNGTPLTDLTNGEVIQKMFPNARCKTNDWKNLVWFGITEDNSVLINKKWWNRKWGE